MARRFIVDVTAGGSLILAVAGVVFFAAPRPVAGYPFAVPPVEVYERLTKAGVPGVEPLPPTDAARLAAFWAARSNKQAVPPADDAAATLHLIACGVPENGRAAYLAKLAALTAAAERAVAGATDDGEKADKLLRFLHQGVMANKYAADQTTLNGVFDTGTFNCVSSSALFFLVGTRLGLTLQPVKIDGEPGATGHAAVDVIVRGRRVRAEPTTAGGYEYADELKPSTAGATPAANRTKAYDCDGFGLAAAAAGNRHAAAVRAGNVQPADRLKGLAVLLTLTPTSLTAAYNMDVTVKNLAIAFDDAKRHAEAVKLHAAARAALGRRDQLEHNYRVFWDHYLDAVFEAGKVAEGVALARQAAAAFPDDPESGDAARWVKRAARRRLDAGDMAGSRAVLTDGLALMPDAPELLAGLARVYDTWGRALRADGKYEEALAKYVEGVRAVPKDTMLPNNALVVVDQWAAGPKKHKDWDAAIRVYDAGLKAFPDDPHLTNNRAYCVQQRRK